MYWPGLEKILMVTLPPLLLLGAINLIRPVPSPQVVYDLAAPATSSSIKIDWPSKGQAAVGALGYGVLDAKPTDEAVPTASVAKVMTALAVLKQKPLTASESGPTISFNQADVDNYSKFLAKDGSVVPVAVGEKMTERQALGALLIPSANNIADKLAVWAYGSVSGYLSAANKLAKDYGMMTSNFSDASGFSPKTISTARDLTILGQVAMANPVIANIVGQKSIKLPVAGVVSNTNWLLGQYGINGIKTGHTDQSGGNFLFSSAQDVSGQKVTIIGTVTGAKDSAAALASSVPLINQARSGFKKVVIVKKGQTVGHYQTAWGKTVPLVAESDLTILNWPGQKINLALNGQSTKTPAPAGKYVGSLKVTNGEKTAVVGVMTGANLASPPLSWRIIRL